MGLDAGMLAVRRPGKFLSPEDASKVVEDFNAYFGPQATMVLVDPDELYSGHLDGCQVFKADMGGIRLFAPGYHRGEWPFFELVLRWLLDRLGPEIRYGGDIDVWEDIGREIDEDMMREYREAWHACDIQKDYMWAPGSGWGKVIEGSLTPPMIEADTPNRGSASPRRVDIPKYGPVDKRA